MELLGAARHSYGPRAIAEVALDLALDRPAGERRERAAVVRVEAIDGLDEPEHRDLADVVVLGAGRAEPPGDVGGQPHVPLDEHVAQVALAGAMELDEELVVGVGHREPASESASNADVPSEDFVITNRPPSYENESTTAPRIRCASSSGPSVDVTAPVPPCDAWIVIRLPSTSNRNRRRDAPPSPLTASTSAASATTDTASFRPSRRSSISSTVNPASAA